MVGSAGAGARIDGRRGADPSDAPDAPDAETRRTTRRERARKGTREGTRSTSGARRASIASPRGGECARGWTVGVARGWDAREHPCARAPSRDAGWTKKLRRASRANDTIHRFRERSPNWLAAVYPELAIRRAPGRRPRHRPTRCPSVDPRRFAFPLRARNSRGRRSPRFDRLSNPPVESQQQAATHNSGRDGRHGALP